MCIFFSDYFSLKTYDNVKIALKKNPKFNDLFLPNF
jgi:hypothetical protein